MNTFEKFVQVRPLFLISLVIMVTNLVAVWVPLPFIMLIIAAAILISNFLGWARGEKTGNGHAGDIADKLADGARIRVQNVEYVDGCAYLTVLLFEARNSVMPPMLLRVRESDVIVIDPEYQYVWKGGKLIDAFKYDEALAKARAANIIS